MSLLDVINGSGHDLDAVAMGYLGPSETMPELAYDQPNEVGSD